MIILVEKTPTYTLMDKLWYLWKEYIDYYVVGNAVSKRILFHSFLGILLTKKGYSYIESANRKSMRLHVFMIQDSGTGKTQIMTAMNNLLTYLGVDSRQTIKDNEASLTGTVYKNDKNGKIENKHGMLARLDSLLWDEGSSLLRKSNFMQDITDVFQGVMDEPGKVMKGMRLGSVDYKSHTTLIAGSYMFPEFGQTLMTKGFLQRMFLIQTILTPKDKRDIRIGVNLLKIGQDFRKIDRLKEAVRILTQKIITPHEQMIVFDIDGVMKFNKVLEQTHKEQIEYQFVGDKQDVLETFFNRLHLLIDKIASQRAIINGKSKVEFEDLMYAKELCDIHLDSLLNVFDSVKRTHINSAQEKRRNMILDIIKTSANGIIFKKELLNELLKAKKKGLWDLGYNRSKSIIEDLISNKVVHSEKSEDGEKLLVVR